MKTYNKIYPSLQCNCCKEVSEEVIAYHQHTMYEDTESNYVELCYACKKDDDQYWEERWEEYYLDCR